MSTAAPKPPTPAEVARREQIVRGTIEAVNERGFRGASLAEIAKRAGVAKSAVLYYFGSRDNLLYAVVEEVFTAFDSEIEAAVATKSTAIERLTAYVETYVTYVDRHRHAMAAGVEMVMSHRDESGTPLYLTTDDEESRLLREIVQQGIVEGVFSEMPTEVGAALITGILDLAIFQVQRDINADLGPLTKEFVPFILRGLGAQNRGQ